MKHYLLIYDLADDYLERRAAFREAHLNLAWEAAAQGALVLGGAVQDPVDTAMLLFKGETPEAVETFARTDPYVLNGLVKAWTVREWATVVGDDAANPVKL